MSCAIQNIDFYDMIIAEKTADTTSNISVTNKNDYNRFGDDMKDGRMTENSDLKVYRLREAINLSRQLGRPLTDDEMKTFEC